MRPVAKSDKPFGGVAKPAAAPKPAFATIDDLLFALSKPPHGLNETEAKATLKALGYKGFLPAKGQEMFDSAIAYLAQERPTDDEKRTVIESDSPIITEDELPF